MSPTRRSNTMNPSPQVPGIENGKCWLWHRAMQKNRDLSSIGATKLQVTSSFIESQGPLEKKMATMRRPSRKYHGPKPLQSSAPERADRKGRNKWIRPERMMDICGRKGEKRDIKSGGELQSRSEPIFVFYLVVGYLLEGTE